jgi:hypothetical protein
MSEVPLYPCNVTAPHPERSLAEAHARGAEQLPPCPPRERKGTPRPPQRFPVLRIFPVPLPRRLNLARLPRRWVLRGGGWVGAPRLEGGYM